MERKYIFAGRLLESVPASLAIPMLLLLAAMAPAQGVDAYIGQLAKPGVGDDSPARLEIRRMTNLAFRPGAETERKSQEASLLSGLSSKPDWEVKDYLMEELGLEGKATAVTPVAAYLGDANLCEPAAMALLSIGTTEGADKVTPPLRSALGASTGRCRVTLMRALGSLRDRDPATVAILLVEAAGTDRTSAYMAQRGLANIGAIQARTALANALKSADAYHRSQAVSLNLLYAQRLAEQGLKAEAVEIADAVKALGSEGNLRNVIANAESTLVVIGRTVAVAPRPRPVAGSAAYAVRRVGGRLQVHVPTPGAFDLRLADIRGRVLGELRGEGAGWYDLPKESCQSGIIRLIHPGRAGSGGGGKITQPLIRP